MNRFRVALKQIFTKETFFEICKYGLVTIVSYFLLIGSIFLLEKVFGLNEKISYAIALTVNYIAIYVSFNKFVFKTTHSMKMLRRFVIVLICSWIANNIFFAIWLDVFSFHYTLAVILNTIVLGGFRFLAQKFYVRR